MWCFPRHMRQYEGLFRGLESTNRGEALKWLLRKADKKDVSIYLYLTP